MEQDSSPLPLIDKQAGHEPSNQEIVNPNELMKQMDHALQYGSIESLMQLFDDGMDINQPDFQDRTALMLCTARGQKEVVEILLERGADVNLISMFQGRIPMSALDAALQTNRTELADLLRTHGAKTGKEIVAEQAQE